MNLPFTPEQFLEVFRRYNEALWPATVLLPMVGVACVALLLLDKRTLSRRLVLVLVGALWAWTAIAYHYAFFSDINPAARWFALLALIQAVLFVVASFGNVAEPKPLPQVDRMVGNVLVTFALVLYPALSYLAGHRFPAMPTFGAPCPTTIFTLGILAWMRSDLSWKYSVIPLAWSAIATVAALQLGMVEDLGLSFAAVALVVLLAARGRPASAHRTHRTREAAT
jgi:hypothetical protein